MLGHAEQMAPAYALRILILKLSGPSTTECSTAGARVLARVIPVPRRTGASSSSSPTPATILIALAKIPAGCSGTWKMWAPPAAPARILASTRSRSTWTTQEAASAPMTCAALASMPASSPKSEGSTTCYAQTTALVTRLMRKLAGILGCRDLMIHFPTLPVHPRKSSSIPMLKPLPMKQALPISLVLRTSIVKPSKVVVTKPVAETRVGLHSLQMLTIASHATVMVELGLTKALARKPR